MFTVYLFTAFTNISVCFFTTAVEIWRTEARGARGVSLRELLKPKVTRYTGKYPKTPMYTEFKRKICKWHMDILYVLSHE